MLWPAIVPCGFESSEVGDRPCLCHDEGDSHVEKTIGRSVAEANRSFIYEQASPQLTEHFLSMTGRMS